MFERIFSVAFLLGFAASDMKIRTLPYYYIFNQPLEVNCTSSIEVLYFEIDVDNNLITGVTLGKNGTCIRIQNGSSTHPCAEDCKCSLDGKSISYIHIVRSNKTRMTLKCTGIKESSPFPSKEINISKANEPSNISINASSIEVVTEKQDVGPISCEAEGCFPECTYTWTGPDGFRINGSILQIDDISRTSNGIYTCRGANILGESFGNVTFIVEYGPSKVILSPANNSYTIIEGENLGPIQCSANCNPVCSLTWSGPGISSSANNLSITNINRTDKGQYICTADNKFEALNITLNVTVQYKPFRNVTIISDPKFYVNESSTLNLVCTVYGGYPLANISFWCENRAVMATIVTASFSITASLTFEVTRTDVNRICICEADHNMWSKPEVKSTKIIVYYSPNPIIIFEGITNGTDLFEFDMGSINCTVSDGNPLAELDFKCGENERGINGNNATSSFSTISMNVTRNLNSQLCICIAQHLLFANEVSGAVLLQVYYPPSKPLLIEKPSQPFLEGQFVEVTCNAVDGNPQINKYEWYINFIYTPNDRQIYIYGNVSKDDNEKNITCRVHNIYTEKKNISVKSDIMTFNVEYKPRIFDTPTEHKVVEGDSIEIKCVAVGNPVPYVHLEYNDQSVSNKNQTETVLDLIAVSRYIQGIYICKAYSMSSHGNWLNSSLSIQLTINYPPDVSVVAIGHDIKEGSSVTLMCNASGQPAKYHFEEWEHSYASTNIRNSINNNGSHLFLMELSYQDMGKYTCGVNNGITNRNRTLIQKASHELKVLGAPIRIPAEPAIPVFSAEQSKLLHAYISFYGFPNVTNITWFNLTSNTKLITKGNTYIDFKTVTLPYAMFTVHVNLTEFCYTASLEISNFQAYHSGFYVLEVSNDEKRVNFTLRAVVSGPPEHPSNITVEVFRRSILVHILPGFNGGHDQYLHINYTQCGQDTMHEKILQDSGTGVQSLIIDNLQPTTQYCIFVFSSNRKGYSSYNDSQCCEEFIILTKGKVSSQSQDPVFAIAGWTVGSILVFSLIVAAIIILYLRRNRKGGDRQHLKYSSKTGDSYHEDEDGLKDNPLYGSAVNNLDHGEDSYSAVNKEQKSKPATNNEFGKKSKKAAKRQLEECMGDIQLDTVYENSNKFLELSSATSNSKPTGRQLTTPNKNKDGLLYADLFFVPQEIGKKLVIRGLENKTNYAFIDFNTTADPLPSDDDEIIEENTRNYKDVD